MSSIPDILQPHQVEHRTVPPVYCPFPLVFDPRTAACADERVADWIKRTGLFPGQRDEVAAFRLGTFAALCHPDAASLDHLMLPAIHFCTLFGADDHYCDESVEGADTATASSRLAGILPALEDSYGFPSSCPRMAASVTDDPVTAGFQEVIHRAANLATPAQLGRLRREIACTVLAMAGETTWRHTHDVPPSWEYLKQRPFNGGTACLSLIDTVGGYELGADEYDDPGVRSLTLAASSMIMMVNDLYSGPKETASSVGSYSLPALLSARHGWSFDQCMRATARLHDRGMREYLRKEKEVSRNASPSVARYLDGLRNWMRGNLEWHATSGRYHQRDGRATPITARDHCTERPPTEAELSTAPGTCPYCAEEHRSSADGLR